MIGRLIDRLVSVFAPQAAVQRAHARRVLERSFDSARSDRLTGHWNPSNKSADLWLLNDADKIRARARDLCANNAYARGIVRALVRNVVNTGIRPQAKTGDKQFNRDAEKLWSRWCEVAEASGGMSFYELQRLVYKETKEAGEALVHFVNLDDDRSRPLPLALELIDIDRLASDEVFYSARGRAPNGNLIRRGIEVDAAGRPVAYWIYPQHQNDIYSTSYKPERMDAANFLHVFRRDRAGQTRGASDFAPIIIWLKQLGYYVENELQASAVASCFTAAIKTFAGAADGGLYDDIDSDATDTDGNTFEYLQPGLVARLMPGEEIETINPSRPNAQADAWIGLMLRSMAVGVGLSYERLTRDYSQTNYSSNRAADLEDRRDFRSEQNWLIRQLCRPIWRRFVESAVLHGSPGFPSANELIADYDEWTSHEWQAPGWEWVDPVKEQKASAEAIATNLSTLTEELGKRGKDTREVLEQKRADLELIDEVLGDLMPDPQPPEAATEPEVQPQDEEAMANG